MCSGESGHHFRLARESWLDILRDMSTSSPNHALQRTRLLRFGCAMSLRFAQRPVSRVAELGRYAAPSVSRSTKTKQTNQQYEKQTHKLPSAGIRVPFRRTIRQSRYCTFCIIARHSRDGVWSESG